MRRCIARAFDLDEVFPLLFPSLPPSADLERIEIDDFTDHLIVLLLKGEQYDLGALHQPHRRGLAGTMDSRTSIWRSVIITLAAAPGMRTPPSLRKRTAEGRQTSLEWTSQAISNQTRSTSLPQK